MRGNGGGGITAPARALAFALAPAMFALAALLFALAALLIAPAARAAPRAPIVVTVPGGARVVVSRDPFGLGFQNARGRTVLRELPTVGRPQVIAPIPQLEFGTIGPPPPTRYAPLGFLVGTSSLSQEPAGQWEGDLTSVTQGGIEYSAQRVLAAAATPHGARLTVATDDPTGRMLIVTLGAGPRPGAIDVRVNLSSTSGVAALGDSFASSPGEAFHGFGGDHDGVDQHGQDFVNWIEQENLGSGSASGLTAPAASGGQRYMFPNGPHAAYYVQSAFVSSAGYGFLLHGQEISRWRLDSDRPDAWQTQIAAPTLHYVVIPASAPTAIRQLTAITGRQPVAPPWAAGSLFDREVKYPSDPAAQYADEVPTETSTTSVVTTSTSTATASRDGPSCRIQC